MPWPYLPADFGATHDTAWVICENDLYDPKRGHEVYNRYLDELKLADHLELTSLLAVASCGQLPGPAHEFVGSRKLRLAPQDYSPWTPRVDRFLVRS